LLRDSAAVQQVMVTRASPESARSSADALDEMDYRWITASRCSTTTRARRWSGSPAASRAAACRRAGRP